MLGIPHRYLTAHLPGVGGQIKQELEDFVVEEVPLYHPSDQGEHCFFEVEKSDLSTLEAVERIAYELVIPVGEFGFAGLKDRKGITRQVISVRLIPPSRVLALHIPQIRILWARLHSNKLRVGHLRGNRFRIRVRGIEPDAVKVERIVDEIRRRGLPNFYGPQRFGNRGDAFRVGRALLQRNPEYAVRRLLGYPSETERNPHVVEARNRFMAGNLTGALEEFPRSYRLERQVLDSLIRSGGNFRKAVKVFSPHVKKLYFSAYQSYLFNRILERRLEESAGDPGRLFAGDLAWIHRSGAVFKVVEAEREQFRADALEISPSGPVFGIKMVQPGGLQSMIENEILTGEGLLPTSFNALMPGLHLEGGRRPLRVPVRELRYEVMGSDIVLEFFLPKGSYATTFLREIMKNEEVPAGYDAPDDAGGPPAEAPVEGALAVPPPDVLVTPLGLGDGRTADPDLEADDEPPLE